MSVWSSDVCSSDLLRMPKITYPRFDFHQVRAELDAVHRAADPEHPLGHYLQQTSESWRIATRLLDVLGSHRVTAYSTRLFGRPVELLPGNGPTNLEAARHFVDQTGRASCGERVCQYV